MDNATQSITIDTKASARAIWVRCLAEIALKRALEELERAEGVEPTPSANDAVPDAVPDAVTPTLRRIG